MCLLLLSIRDINKAKIGLALILLSTSDYQFNDNNNDNKTTQKQIKVTRILFSPYNGSKTWLSNSL